MHTIMDQPVDFEDFLAERREARAAAAAMLLGFRAELKAQRQQHEENVERSAAHRPIKFDLGLYRMIHSRNLPAEMKEILKHSQYIEEHFHVRRSHDRRFVFDERNKVTAQDKADFRRAVRAGAGDDAILAALPDTTVAKDAGWRIYRQTPSFRILGEREVLRCDHRQTICASNSPVVVRAALAGMMQRQSPPYRVGGTPEFIEQVERIAKELGIEIEQRQQRGLRFRAPADAASEVTTDTATTADTSSPSTRPSDTIEVDTTDERFVAIAATAGRPKCVAPSPNGRCEGPVAGIVTGYFADRADGKTDAAVIVGSAFACVVIPVAPGSLTVGDMVKGSAAQNDWTFTITATQAVSIEPKGSKMTESEELDEAQEMAEGNESPVAVATVTRASARTGTHKRKGTTR